MPTPDTDDRVVRFGLFELDVAARRLKKRGRHVRLQDKPFETLVLLLERPGAIVTRDELRQRLWPADTFVVFDDSLNTAVRKLREALGDSADNPRFVETVPRHGYRFIASVEAETLVPLATPAAELIGTAVGEAVSETANKPHPWFRHSASATLLTALLAAGGVGWLVWSSGDGDESFRSTPLTTLPGEELYPSMSPDGNYVTFTWLGPEQDGADLYVQMVGSGSPLRLTAEAGHDYSPAWSPDGRWIAFLRFERTPQISAPAENAELRVIPPLGGPSRLIAEIWIRSVLGNPNFLAWCPDSSCLLVTDSLGPGRPDALFVVSVESGKKRQLTHPAPPVLGDTNPAVSPDGGTLVFRRLPAGSAGELYWVTLGPDVTVGSAPRRLTLGRLNAEYPAWMPDGGEIVFSALGNLWTLRVPGQEPPALPTRLAFGEEGSMPAVSREVPGRPTRMVYVRRFNDANVWRLHADVAGAEFPAPVVSISSTRMDINPEFSPTGHRVAFASRRSGSMEIWLADSDGANAVQLTSMEAQTTTPRWSPDGKLVAFQSNREGQFDVFVVPAAGGTPRNMTSHGANDNVPTFSRDGKWIYFSSTRGGVGGRIWKMPAEGGEAVPLPMEGGFAPIEGTDGRHIYFVGTPGARGLWRIPAGGGQPTQVLDGVVATSFAVLETGIYYADRVANDTRLQYHDFATGTSTVVARNLGDITPLITASADGRTVLFARIDTSIHDLMLVEQDP